MRPTISLQPLPTSKAFFATYEIVIEGNHRFSRARKIMQTRRPALQNLIHLRLLCVLLFWLNSNHASFGRRRLICSFTITEGSSLQCILILPHALLHCMVARHVTKKAWTYVWTRVSDSSYRVIAVSKESCQSNALDESTA